MAAFGSCGRDCQAAAHPAWIPACVITRFQDYASRDGLQGVHGVEKTECYLIDILLPSAITFNQVRVVKGNFCNGGWDVIIGMNIIGAREFSVTNVDSNTEFSFRVPSQHHIERSETSSRGALNWLRSLVGRGAT
jgi:hypothetical protein